MAKKKVLAVVKIQIPAGKATPAPPVGTAWVLPSVWGMNAVPMSNFLTSRI